MNVRPAMSARVKFNDLRNARGSAILWAIVVMAILTALIPSLVSIVTDAGDRQAQRRMRGDYLVAMSSLRNQLEDPLLCKEYLRGQRIDLTPSALNAGAALATGIVDVEIAKGFGATLEPIKPGWKMAPGLMVDSVRIRTLERMRNPDGSMRSIRLDVDPEPDGTNVVYDTYRIRVLLVPRGLNLNFSDQPPFVGPDGAVRNFEPSQPGYNIDLYANVRGNVIRNCFGYNSVAAVCEAVGGGFDADQVTPTSRCHPDKRCFQNIQGVVDNPSLCVAPYDTAGHVGNFGGVDKYICSWCWDGSRNYP